jgi:ribosomal-protein-alanine acetyltransferase
MRALPSLRSDGATARTAQADMAPLPTRPMSIDDLDQVMAIEQRIYPFPWTRGNFADSLAAGYRMPVLELDGRLVGYAVMMWLPDEVHLLNLSIDQACQRQGLGRRLLEGLLEEASQAGARGMLLEVRPSNLPAQRLYRESGFETIGLRKRYYPSWNQTREDAIVMFRSLR